jgi:hypothetical protein
MDTYKSPFTLHDNHENKDNVANDCNLSDIQCTASKIGGVFEKVVISKNTLFITNRTSTTAENSEFNNVTFHLINNRIV